MISILWGDTNDFSHLLRRTPFFEVKLGAPSFARIKPRLHLGHRAGEDDERVDALNRRSNALRIPYVADEHVVSTSDFGFALLGPDQPSSHKLARPLLELLVHNLAWIISKGILGDAVGEMNQGTST